MGLAGTQQRESPGGDTWGAAQRGATKWGEGEDSHRGQSGSRKTGPVRGKQVGEGEDSHRGQSGSRKTGPVRGKQVGEGEERRKATAKTKGHKTLLLNERTEKANEPGRAREKDVKRNEMPCVKACFPL